MARPRPLALAPVCVGLAVFLGATLRGALSLTYLEACEEFLPDPQTPAASWGFIDCVEVWKAWAGTIDQDLHQTYPDVEMLRDLSGELREKGTPCIVREEKTLDGTGSSTIRHMASWLYAKEVGCDWITPDFNQGNVAVLANPDNNLEDLDTLYCHRTEYIFKFNASRPLLGGGTEARRCATVSWLHFFQMHLVSVPPPTSGVVKEIELTALNSTELAATVNDTMLSGVEDAPWDWLQLSFDPQEAAKYAANVGSWSASKRQHARDVLHDLREGFHQYPRPGFKQPTCPYDSSRLSFAIHIRLGDRGKGMHAITKEYRSRLDKLMFAVSEAVEAEGQLSPQFHVFSETVEPCPSEETGAFDEFPDWPLEADEIRACLNAKAPDDCPEKQAGGDFCYPERSGVFHVRGSPIVLNLGADVVNALSCLIAADGIIMGCSAFAIIAGILSNGMRLFSTGCGGPMTWEQNQIAPPLAISERGEMWVPVGGSWRDPHLRTTHILRQALRQHLANTGK